MSTADHHKATRAAIMPHAMISMISITHDATRDIKGVDIFVLNTYRRLNTIQSVNFDFFMHDRARMRRMTDLIRRLPGDTV